MNNPFKIGDKIIAITNKKDAWPDYDWNNHLFTGNWCTKEEILTIIDINYDYVYINYKLNGKCCTPWYYFKKCEKSLNEKLLDVILS